MALRRAHERHAEGAPPHRWSTFDAKGEHPALRGLGLLDLLDEEQLGPSDAALDGRDHRGERITYVVDGALEFDADSGARSVLHAGDFQRHFDSAAKAHGERNASSTNWAHVFQIGLRGGSGALVPAHQEHHVSPDARRGSWCVVASNEQRTSNLELEHDVRILSCLLDPGQTAATPLLPNRAAWLQVVAGRISTGVHALRAGDGALIRQQPTISVTAHSTSEVLLIDVPDDHDELLWNGD